MINELDEVLRQFLIRELPIRNGEVDISLDQPKREWAARLSRPTLNIFLYDIHENIKERGAQPSWQVIKFDNGTITQRRKPVKVDLRYLITAWANEPEDEHRLLGRVLMALYRYPYLPEDLLPETFEGPARQIPIKVAQEEEMPDTSLMWSSLDDEMRAAVSCVLTLPLNPYQPTTTGLVRTRELRFGQTQSPAFLERLIEQAGQDVYWTIGGTVHSEQPLEDARMALVEQGREVTLHPNGRFAIGHLRSGDYTLEVTIDGGEPSRFKISVPSADYDLEI